MIKTLNIWEEAIGNLKNIEENGDRLTLDFGNGKKVSIPNELKLKKKIKGKIGKKIGIVHTDLKDKEFLIQNKVDNRKGAFYE